MKNISKKFKKLFKTVDNGEFIDMKKIDKLEFSIELWENERLDELQKLSKIDLIIKIMKMSKYDIVNLIFNTECSTNEIKLNNLKSRLNKIIIPKDK